MSDTTRIVGLAGRAKPARLPDGTEAAARTTGYGDVLVQTIGTSKNALVDEGSFFRAVNPTPGTGIAGIVAADGYNAAETLLMIYNTATAAEGTRIYLDSLELQCTVVDTAGTDIRFDHHIDNTDRYTSGGTAYTAQVPCLDSSASPKGRMHFGAIISTAASSSVRYLGGRQLSSTDLVANDLILLTYGQAAAPSSQTSSLTEEATLARFWQVPCGPVVLGPGQCYLFTINCASQNGAATWTFNATWYER